MAEGGGSPRARTRSRVQRRARVRWSEPLGWALCERIAAGELFQVICREAGMPTAQTVGRWAREKPAFGEALAAARVASGRKARAGGGVWTYCKAAADEVFDRLCAGESLNQIGGDPVMPSVSTLFYWRRNFPEFDAAVRLAMDIRAEQLCDRAAGYLEGVTPQTAYMTHVQLTHLRWWTGVLAPRVYRARPAEAEKPQEVKTVLYRRFEIERDPVSGKDVVVAYCPNPVTGAIEREAPGWVQPGDCDTFSMPGGRLSGRPSHG